MKLKHHPALVFVSPKLKHQLHRARLSLCIACAEGDGLAKPRTKLMDLSSVFAKPRFSEAEASPCVGVCFAEAKASASLAWCAKKIRASKFGGPDFFCSIFGSNSSPTPSLYVNQRLPWKKGLSHGVLHRLRKPLFSNELCSLQREGLGWVHEILNFAVFFEKKMNLQPKL